ncbi:MAG: hypothetical protein WBB69_11440 [Anaerolineales bacterium]
MIAKPFKLSHLWSPDFETQDMKISVKFITTLREKLLFGTEDNTCAVEEKENTSIQEMNWLEISSGNEQLLS